MNSNSENLDNSNANETTCIEWAVSALENDVEALGTNLVFRRPVVLDYTSTFLPEGSKNTYADSHSICRAMAAHLWAGSGNLEQKEELYSWFQNSLCNIAEGFDSTFYDFRQTFGQGSGLRMDTHYTMYAE